jgi:formate dehydrogenase maturation protein FdhE
MGRQVYSLMTKLLRSATLFLLLVAGCGGAAQVLAQSQSQSEAQQAPAPEQDESNASGVQPLTLTEQVVRDVLEPLQRGIEEHSTAQVLAVFDQQETPNYAQLRDQMRAFFSQNATVRFRYKVLQVTAEKDHGFAIAEIDMAATPADETQLGVQRSTQMRFQIKLGPKGWKLVGFKPADFFTQ